MESELTEILGRKVDLGLNANLLKKAKTTYAGGISCNLWRQSMWRDDAYLLDMLLAARKVQNFTQNATRENFQSDLSARRMADELPHHP